MVGILIAGHGGFPSGVLSAVNLVAGNPGNVTAVDFVEGMSTDELKARMLAALDGMEQEEILVLTDLAGGTPFRTAAEIKAVYTGKRMRVVAGANMPAVVEAAFSSGDMDLDRADRRRDPDRHRGLCGPGRSGRRGGGGRNRRVRGRHLTPCAQRRTS